MLLKAHISLHYPITIAKILKSRDEEVERSTQLLTYLYKAKVSEGDRITGLETLVEKEFPAQIESPVDGTIKSWLVKEGDVIEKPGKILADISEPCMHEVQFGGMCADCGKDMKIPHVSSFSNDSRATIQKVHGHTELKISQSAAVRLEQDEKKRLVNSKKLSLVVDLDQTVIHATCETTVAEWQADPTNPNHEAVKDVRSFQLMDDGQNGRGVWYYIKFRPGLVEFLERVSKIYEMHVYTAGTRAYARNVAKLLDPDRKYFGDRILSRDERLTKEVGPKHLTRLFPVSTKMVVVIDDRADVWQFSEHLIRVSAYNFFPGTGDVNWPFIEQAQLVTRELKAPPPPQIVEPEDGQADQSKTEENGVVEGDSSVTNDTSGKEEDEISKIGEQLLSAASDPGLVQEQESKQDELITHLIEDRPLLQKQLQLDKAEEAAEIAEREEAAKNPDAPVPVPHRRVPLLHDEDTELEYLQNHLMLVHDIFYADFEEKVAGAGGRLADLKGAAATKASLDDDSLMPDVKDIMVQLKSQVLQGVYILFTGLIPRNEDPRDHYLGRWAMEFGAKVSNNLTKKTTHVIAVPDQRTNKAKRAARHPHIKIVDKSWLMQCIQEWAQVDEEPYLITVEQDKPQSGSTANDFLSPDDLEDPEFLSAEDEGTTFTDDEINTPADSDEEELSPDVNLYDEDWAKIEQEIADDAEGDDTEDDSENDNDNDNDNESTRSATESEAETPTTKPTPNGTKRKRGSTPSADPSDVEDSDTASITVAGSKLQRRKKRAYQRVSSLTNMSTSIADSSKSGLPSPDTTGPEEAMDDGGKFEARDDGDVDDDDLEAEMMREMGEGTDEDV